jgi:hypothetical protein
VYDLPCPIDSRCRQTADESLSEAVLSALPCIRRQEYRILRILGDCEALSLALALFEPSKKERGGDARLVLGRALKRAQVAGLTGKTPLPISPDEAIPCPNCLVLLDVKDMVRNHDCHRKLIRCNSCQDAFCYHCRFPHKYRDYHLPNCVVASFLLEEYKNVLPTTPSFVSSPDSSSSMATPPTAVPSTPQAPNRISSALVVTGAAVSRHGGKVLNVAGHVLGVTLCIPVVVVGGAAFVLASPVILIYVIHTLGRNFPCVIS